MIYAHVYENYRKANYGYAEYVKTNQHIIKKAIHYKNLVIDRYDNEHNFLTEARYESWCKDKTYKLMSQNVESGLMVGGYPYVGKERK